MYSALRYLLVLPVLFAMPTHASDLHEKLAEAIVFYVANGRNFTLIESETNVGTVYEAPSVSSPNELDGVINSAKAMDPDVHRRVDSSVLGKTEDQEYLLGTSLAKMLAEQMAGDLTESGIDVDAFASALRKSQMHFKLYRHNLEQPYAELGLSEHWNSSNWYLLAAQGLSIDVLSYRRGSDKAIAEVTGQENVVKKAVDLLSRDDVGTSSIVAVKLQPVALTGSVSVAASK